VTPGGLLEGRTIVVTGAGRGLGRAYAEHAAAAGAAVVVNDIDVDEARSVAATLPRAIPSGHDVADPGDAEALVDLARRELGPLGGLVNNAGLYYEAAPWEEEPDRLRRLIEVNVLGSLFCTAAAARAFREQRSGGAIVNATSGALFGFPSLGAYGASKGAIISLTLSTALDLAELGVRVNAVAPIAATRLTLAAQVGRRHIPKGASRVPLEGIEERTPDRIAPLVTYLLSSLADHHTGRAFRFDGTRLSRLSLGDAGGEEATRRDHWDVEAVAEALGASEAET
jgi:NAD(P)-dependent dehydrogenase (short-subunit alcohol dehydrogenase family)